MKASKGDGFYWADRAQEIPSRPAKVTFLSTKSFKLRFVLAATRARSHSVYMSKTIDYYAC